MANLRVGLVGLGMMGRHHARVLSSLDGVDLVAVVDPEGDRFGAASHTTTLESVGDLIEKRIDYCVVAVPTAFHEEVALQLADARIHVLVEKPLAPTVSSALVMVDAFESKGLVNAVGHIERFNSAIQQARSRIANGDIGDIYQVTTRRQGPFPGRIADVGVVKDLGTHDIDLTSWITQESYEQVTAVAAYKSGRQYEDLVAATGKLSGGTVVNHLVNWLSAMKERTTVITGEKGTLVADTLTSDLTFHANGVVANTWDNIASFRGVTEGETVRFAFSKPEPLRTQHEAFRDAVLGKKSPIVSMRDGLSIVGVAEAWIESAKAGRMVAIPTAWTG